MSIKTLYRLTLIRVSLCFEGLQGIFFFLFFFFYGKVKLICKLRHKFFINLRLWQVNNLRSSALFLRDLRYVAGRFTHSAICGNTIAHPLYRSQSINFYYQNLPGWELRKWKFPWMWIIKVRIIWVRIFLVRIFLNGNCLGRNCLDWELFGRGRGGCPGGNYPIT